MDKNNMAEQAERCRQEMMKLYSRRTASDESEPAPKPKPEPIPEDNEYEPEILSEEDADYEESPQPVTDFSELYPEPDLSELETDYGQADYDAISIQRKGYADESALGTSKGFIKVNVRTGDQSEPVVNASVEISAIIDGNRLLIASAVTDESGAAPVFEVNAPDSEYSQSPLPSEKPYSLYDVSVKAEGFFNSRSVDIPVFGGITSVQTFSMIPVPLYFSPDSETVTYFNQEPNL